jgi:AbrB family looped-hinge helix DNA binding protein
MIITLQARNTVTIPQELRRTLDLRPGDPLEVHVENGRLILDPVAVVPRSLRLTASGDAKEAEADEDIRRRRLTEAESAAALLRELDG